MGGKWRQSPYTALPASPGTYVIILEASSARRLRVGALGTLELEPGFYAYVGSARGPGGLAARLAHHRRRARSPHWHVDYLRRHTALREAWLAESGKEGEHRWAEALRGSPGASVPLARFGATDCRCPSHLFRFARRPSISTFHARLAAAADGVASRAGLARWVASPQAAAHAVGVG